MGHATMEDELAIVSSGRGATRAVGIGTMIERLFRNRHIGRIKWRKGLRACSGGCEQKADTPSSGSVCAGITCLGLRLGRQRGIEGAGIAAVWDEGMLKRSLYFRTKGEVNLTLCYFWDFAR